MKYIGSIKSITLLRVAPLVGAWIEIDQLKAMDGLEKVAPLVGAWIEIINVVDVLPPMESLLL